MAERPSPTGRAEIRCSGSGGQGVVFLSTRRGSDHFTLPVALSRS